MNFYTDVTITGTFKFEKDIIGNLPKPLISQEDGNIILDNEDGLFAPSVTFASSDYQDPALTIYGTGTQDSPIFFKVNTAMKDDNRITIMNFEDEKGLYVPPEVLSSDAGNSLTYRQDGLYSPTLKYKDVSVLHVYNEDQNDQTNRANNAGVIMRMKDVFTNETNINIVSFIPLGIYMYNDTGGNTVDVMTTVGVTQGYDCFISMAPYPNKVLKGNITSNCNVNDKTSHPIIRIFYTSN